MKVARHASALPALLPGLEMRLQKERVGELDITLETLDDLDDVIDQMFAALAKSGRTSTVRDVCPHFGVVWPSGRALAAHLVEILRCDAQADARRPRVLELGCGLALPSIVAAKLGCAVLATDRHPLTPEVLRRNAARNGIHVDYAEVDWRQGAGKLGEFDLIIASDVLYDAFQPAALSTALAELLSRKNRAIVVDPGRRYLDQFIALAEAQGIETTLLETSAANGRRAQGIMVIELRRAP